MSQIEAGQAAPLTLGQALRLAFSSKPFVIAVVVMSLSAGGLWAATRYMEMHFRKFPVVLNRPLEMVPQQMGHWVQVSTDQPLESDIEDTLGTKKYIFRDYVDTRLMDADKLAKLLAKDTQDRRRMLTDFEMNSPRAVIHLAVTYYTGMVDTVSHVADRCYIADGYAPTEYELRKWKLSDGAQVEVRFINFEDATGFASRVPKNVAYFFQVNGVMESSPSAVRFRLQNLFNDRSYYAKVELMTLLRNREDSAKVMTDFLSQVYPEIKKCLPQPGQEKIEVVADEKAGK